MGIKLDSKVYDIIRINERIINSLKAQKARQDQIVDRYEDVLEEELNIPSNKYMPWASKVGPFVDSVISSKILDYELVKAHEAFIKEIIKHAHDVMYTEEQIDELEYSFDVLVNNIFKLEGKLLRIKQDSNNKWLGAKIHTINLYQKIPKDLKREDSECTFCGIRTTNSSNNTKICQECLELPEEIFEKIKNTYDKDIEVAVRAPPKKQKEEFVEEKPVSKKETEKKEEEKKVERKKEVDEGPEFEDGGPSDLRDRGFIETPEGELVKPFEVSVKKDPRVDSKKDVKELPDETPENRRIREDFERLMKNFQKKYSERELDEKRDEILRKKSEKG